MGNVIFTFQSFASHRFAQKNELAVWRNREFYKVLRRFGFLFSDSVYFDTNKYGKYGKLCKAFPGEEHSIKQSTSDFALWKASKPGEPFWESPWGNGRPGWHIECSAIARFKVFTIVHLFLLQFYSSVWENFLFCCSTIFGNSIDIHSGGIDLLFPHHENEEAQSCCYHGVNQWVNYWFHSGHLYLPGSEKMSKSLQNTISIQDLLKTYSSNQFRLFCLLTHYRTGRRWFLNTNSSVFVDLCVAILIDNLSFH